MFSWQVCLPQRSDFVWLLYVQNHAYNAFTWLNDFLGRYMFRGDQLTSFLLWQRCSVVRAFSDFWNFVMVAFIEWYIFVLVFSDGPILKVTGEFEEKKTYDSMYSPVLNMCQLSNSSLSVQDLVSANCKVFSYKILQGHWWTTFLFRNKSIIFEITAKSIVIKVWCILNIQHDYIYCIIHP